MSTSLDNLSEEHSSRAPRTLDEFSTSEPLTTEHSLTDKPDHDDLLFTTVEPTTQVNEHERRSLTTKLEEETESETDKREIQVELTTIDIPSFTSTSSAVAPQFYTSESSTSTEKYTGRIKDEEEQPKQYTEMQRRPTVKSQEISTKKSKVQSEEDLNESIVPTTVFHQEALSKISNVSNDFMILDENNDVVVTDLPDKLSTTTIKKNDNQNQLNQGSTLLLFLLAALLFCACLLTSTLAFVKNRHTLKRKSRIIEMEAHLDDHYQYYLYPFIFQQHHEK